MEMLNYSSASAVLRFSLNQLKLFRRALSDVATMLAASQITDGELGAVMRTSREGVAQLTQKIDDFIESCGEAQEDFDIYLSINDIDSLRGLLVEIIYCVYFPRFSQFSSSDLSEIDKIVDFLAFDVAPKMEEGTILQLKHEKRQKTSQELKFIRANIWSKHESNFDFENINKYCELQMANNLLKFWLKGLNHYKGSFCQIYLSVFDLEGSLIEAFEPQNIQLQYLVELISHLEFFAEFDGESTDEKLDDVYVVSIINQQRQGFLEIGVVTNHLGVGNQDIDVVFHVESAGTHEQDRHLRFEGSVKKLEILKFTKPIRDFILAICN